MDEVLGYGLILVFIIMGVWGKVGVRKGIFRLWMLLLFIEITGIVVLKDCILQFNYELFRESRVLRLSKKYGYFQEKVIY